MGLPGATVPWDLLCHSVGFREPQLSLSASRPLFPGVDRMVWEVSCFPVLRFPSTEQPKALRMLRARGHGAGLNPPRSQGLQPWC